MSKPQPQKAIEKGFSYIILSDRAFGPQRVPIPSLLATGAVHHHLVALKMRTRAGLLVETAEVRSLLTTDKGLVVKGCYGLVHLCACMSGRDQRTLSGRNGGACGQRAYSKSIICQGFGVQGSPLADHSQHCFPASLLSLLGLNGFGFSSWGPLPCF